MANCLVVLLSMVGLGEEVEPTLQLGQAAPTFTLPLYNAEAQHRATMSLEDLVGPEASEPGVKLVVLSFFATFCEPCKKEMPFLQHLQDSYGDRGLRVLLVSIDRDDDAQAKIAELLRKNHVTLPVLRDRYNFLARRYLGEKAPLPSVFLIGKDGMVCGMNRGYGKEGSDYLLAEVQKGIGSAAGPVAKP
jgi:thiol-disulfide isomerase/thioredoxin